MTLAKFLYQIKRKKLLALVLVVFFLNAFSAFGQSRISSTMESGFLSFGDNFHIVGQPGDTIIYAFDGEKPNSSSKWFVGEKTFIVSQPNEHKVLFAKVNTMVRHPDNSSNWLSRDYAQPDYAFSKVDSVGKIYTIWLQVKGCNANSCIKRLQFIDPDQYKKRHGDTPLVALFGAPNDFWGDYKKTNEYPNHGIFIEGECLPIKYWDSIPEPSNLILTPESYDSIDVNSESISVYGVSLSADKLDSINIDRQEATLTMNSGIYQARFYGVEIIDYNRKKKSININYKGKLVDVTYEKFSCNGKHHRPNFKIRDDLYDLYPFLNDSIVNKKTNALILSNNKVVHVGESFTKTNGQTSSYFPDKSISVKFPKGQRLKYKMIPNGPKKWSSAYLRNMGSKVNLKDITINRIVYDEGVGAQLGIPCALYINGEYNGVRWFREKLNNKFIQHHYGYDDDEIIKFRWADEYYDRTLAVHAGSYDQNLKYDKWLSQLRDKLDNSDINAEGIPELIGQHLDITSFLKARFIYSFFENRDDSILNTRLFMDSTEQVVFEMLKDLDITMEDWKDTYGFEQFFQRSAKVKDRGWYLNKFLENDELRNRYVNIAYDMLSTSLQPDSMMKDIDWIIRKFKPQMKQHFDRWGHLPTEGYWADNSINTWESSMKDFCTNRPSHVSGYLMNHFGYSDTTSVYFNIEMDDSTCINDEVAMYISDVKSDPSLEYTWRHTPVGIPAPIKVECDNLLYFTVNDEKVKSLDTFTAEKNEIYRITAVCGCEK